MNIIETLDATTKIETVTNLDEIEKSTVLQSEASTALDQATQTKTLP